MGQNKLWPNFSIDFMVNWIFHFQDLQGLVLEMLMHLKSSFLNIWTYWNTIHNMYFSNKFDYDGGNDADYGDDDDDDGGPGWPGL